MSRKRRGARTVGHFEEWVVAFDIGSVICHRVWLYDPKWNAYTGLVEEAVRMTRDEAQAYVDSRPAGMKRYYTIETVKERENGSR